MKTFVSCINCDEEFTPFDSKNICAECREEADFKVKKAKKMLKYEDQKQSKRQKTYAKTVAIKNARKQKELFLVV